MKKTSKRKTARIVTFLSAGILVLSLFCVSAVLKAKDYERKAEAMYQKNLAAANEYLSDIDDVMLKGLYSENASNQSSMCADLWMDAYEAKNAISSLPISDIDMEKCYTFLSKTAEYAKAAEKQIAAGEKLTDAQHTTFLNIKKKANSLANSFDKLQKIYLNSDEKISGGIDFSFAVPKSISSSSATSESLNSLNKNLADAPKLIYDGPYSDSVNEKEPQMLKNEKKISIKKATVIAEEFLKTVDGELKLAGGKKGNIPCYTFSKGNAFVEISLYGGKIVSYNTNGTAQKQVLGEKDCLNAAQKYLTKMGYKNMKCDYYETANNIFVANFHYVAGEVNCYTDLIKVKVNTESGSIFGFDAQNYLTNHTQRSFEFKLNAAQAQQSVSKYLSVKSIKKALIPSETGKEILCYEFRCVANEGQELLVFIDAKTGTEADILILEIGANSVLTK